MNQGSNGGDFVRITNREIYDAIVNLKDRVAGVERRLDDVLSENVELRKRVRALELRTYAVMSGIITALPVLARMGGII